MSIRVLPDDLVNRIAAGEVVERPASALKELIENSLDAGASKISITTANGGKSLLRVEDNGKGMNEDDLILSIERHATSKLDKDNLDDIRSLGFRGEALASIGSVSELIIASKTIGADSGLKLSISQSKRINPKPFSMNFGTIVEVKNLFDAIPARKKFLKSDRAENSAITDVIKRQAMANPNVHFILEGSDRATKNWSSQRGKGALAARVAQVMGADFVNNSMPIDFTWQGVSIAGLAGLPTFSKANSLSQFYFVNGRAVRDKILLGATRAAFADYLFRDRFPVVALFVSIEPSEVDVNVHPAKTEVRFRDSGAVRSAIIRAIKLGLENAGYKASSSVAEATISAFKSPNFGTGFSGNYSTPQQQNSPSVYEPMMSGLSDLSARFEHQTIEPETNDFPLGVARAQLFENFIVAQSQKSLLLIDQHAAHERLVYERFKQQMHNGVIESQAQLIPIIIELSEEDCNRLAEAAPMLEKLGLSLEKFGERAIAVRQTPALIKNLEINTLISDLVDELAEHGSSEILGTRMEAILATMACHGSIRSGRILKPEEMNTLLRDMENTPHSGQCIHGRPTYVELEKTDIEKLFGRS